MLCWVERGMEPVLSISVGKSLKQEAGYPISLLFLKPVMLFFSVSEHAICDTQSVLDLVVLLHEYRAWEA